MFNQGVRNFRETGLEKQLFYNWFGDSEKPSSSIPSEGHVRTLSEMVVPFFMMLAVFVVLFVLCGELAYNHFFKSLQGDVR